MKIPHLPITDLARIAVLPKDMQRHSLRQVTGGGGGPNYNPTRANFADIVNRRPGIFEAVRTPWPAVVAAVVKKCHSQREEVMNRVVSKSLYEYCIEQQIKAIEVEGYPLSFSIGPRIISWSPAVFIYPDRLSIPFIDLRRSYDLYREAQRFIFSTQHEALRALNPDYSEIQFEILKFLDESNRPIKVIPEAGFRLFIYDELEEMIVFTQRLWIDVCLERTDGKRKSGSKGPGDLL